jgi:hypothetical protein
MAIEIDFMQSYDLESISEEMRRIAKRLGKQTLSYADISTHGRIDPNTVKRKFGTMDKAHTAAGLVPPGRKMTDAEILQALLTLWEITAKESGRSPIARELKEHGSLASIDTVLCRFGSWKKALVAAAAVAPASVTKELRKMPVPQRHQVGDTMRFMIFRRDGYKCRICRLAADVLEVDHVIPRARGGSNKEDNLQTLCARCNRGKSDHLQ